MAIVRGWRLFVCSTCGYKFNLRTRRLFAMCPDCAVVDERGHIYGPSMDPRDDFELPARVPKTAAWR